MSAPDAKTAVVYALWLAVFCGAIGVKLAGHGVPTVGVALALVVLGLWLLADGARRERA